VLWLFEFALKFVFRASDLKYPPTSKFNGYHSAKDAIEIGLGINSPSPYPSWPER